MNRKLSTELLDMSGIWSLCLATMLGISSVVHDNKITVDENKVIPTCMTFSFSLHNMLASSNVNSHR